jgi:hypothetical protein
LFPGCRTDGVTMRRINDGCRQDRNNDVMTYLNVVPIDKTSDSGMNTKITIARPQSGAEPWGDGSVGKNVLALRKLIAEGLGEGR